MSVSSRRALLWTPRALTIGFALFLSLFALDVFNEGYSFWNTLLALGVHLIPTAIVVVILGLAWRWEWVGALLFAAAGILYLVNTLKHPSWIVSISGPLFLIAVLFLIGWLKHAELHAKPQGR